MTVNVGDKFNRLLVVRSGPHDPKNKWWVCLCECGQETKVQQAALAAGIKKSCGCLRRELIAGFGERNVVHGCRRGQKSTPEYHSWMSMKARCRNPADPYFAHYGGRGIEVCARWLESFENFLADMGPRPEGHTLDRREVDGNYEPGNCKWSTTLEQNRNMTTTKLSVAAAAQIREMAAQGVAGSEIAKHFGVVQQTVSKVITGATWATEIHSRPGR